MNIRLTILSLCLPLFLLLAGLNGALLIRQEMMEMERALDNQAIAAAVTVAAFAAEASDPAAYLTDPVRLAAVQRAAADIADMRALYLARPRRIVARLIETEGTVSAALLNAPAAPMVLPVKTNTAGQRMVAGLAPVSSDAFVVSEIDAEPLYARLTELKRMAVLLLIAAGVIGGVLAFLIARRVKRELGHTQSIITAQLKGTAPPPLTKLYIQETRDLEAAVRLMGTSLAARLERGRRAMAERDLRRDEADGVAAHHRASFPPVSCHAAGASIEVRLLGAAPAGCFFALCQSPDKTHAAVVMGECTASEPASALALALAARNFFMAHMYDAVPEEAIALGKAAFDLSRIAWFAWTEDHKLATQASALLDDKSTARAVAYAGQSGTLGAEAVMQDLIQLLPASGVLAVFSQPLRPQPARVTAPSVSGSI